MLLNKAVKYRESFRPFAPSVLREYCDQIFDDYVDSYYMEKVLNTIKPETLSRTNVWILILKKRNT